MKKKRPPKSAALARIDAAARPTLKRAARMQTFAGVLWPAQAAAAAWSLKEWVDGTYTWLWFAAAVFVVVGILRAVLMHRSGAILFDTADRVIAEERQALLAREIKRTEQAASSAEIAALVAQKLSVLTPYLTQFQPVMARVRVIPLLLAGLTFYFSWAAGLALLIAGPLVPVFMAIIGIRAQKASEKQMVEIGDMNRLLIDRLSALADIRLLDATERAEADFENRAEGLRARTMAVLRVAFLSSTALELFASVGIATIAIFVGFSLLGEIGWGAWQSGLSFYEGVFILLLAPEYFQPLRDMATAWHDRAGALSVAAELDKLEAMEGDEVPGHGDKVAPLAGRASVATLGALVSRGGKPVTLPDFEMQPGEAIALCGDSGAGKSTCLMALAGLVPVQGGQITVAGATLTEETADAWRTRVALIPQLVHMPDVSLLDFLSPDGTGDIAAALKLARAEGIVAALPEGLATRLGETGAGVSGGEARRLLIARAILRGADVVLADEPTADLDAATAADVVAALRGLADAGASVLVASHDPAVIEVMDRSVFVEGAA
ncbi:thiol reductant ABC exporter subunit CydD [Pelagimonas sp. KU-00592-HH]|uniref:ABC transporter ATP-binding protein/permease n=1 Tax=Pelagimonas sp. KU-00592-HH TaxID=3127651 RepID=UPI0031032CAD